MRLNLQSHRNLLVGFFVFSSIVIFLMGITIFLTTEGIFNPQYKLIAVFDNGIGIRKGTAVLYNGVRVGSISKVNLLKPSDKFEDMGKVSLTLRIDQTYRYFINEHSVAYVMRDKNLVSDRVINIESSLMSKSILRDNDTLNTSHSRDVETVLSSVNELVGKVGELTLNIEKVVAQVKDSSSTIGALLGSDDLYVNVMGNLERLNQILGRGQTVLDNAENIGGGLQETLPQLFARVDTTLAAFSSSAENAQETIKNLNGISDKVSGILDEVEEMVVDGQAELQNAGHLVHALSDFWFIRSKIEKQKNMEYPLLNHNLGPQ